MLRMPLWAKPMVSLRAVQQWVLFTPRLPCVAILQWMTIATLSLSSCILNLLYFLMNAASFIVLYALTLPPSFHIREKPSLL